jgi:hypothetical protein
MRDRLLASERGANPSHRVKTRSPAEKLAGPQTHINLGPAGPVSREIWFYRVSGQRVNRCLETR